ncbi:4-hydroxybenzoate octaprenyltransferase [Mannheimia haemolytica]|uniref:4-hydroxybenzoate octaprenyltransferase n=1 Tax=Mannheimia haemolytica TaxID=75985 RepID=A0A378N927_MANHA|nr:4-hydroxybenzoate octaprenyltransferase [Mannheimia haemolytica]
MVDRDDDLRIGVKSTAILFAQYDNKIIALLQFITLILLGLLGVVKDYHIGYFVVLALSATLFIYQCWLTKKENVANALKRF